MKAHKYKSAEELRDKLLADVDEGTIGKFLQMKIPELIICHKPDLKWHDESVNLSIRTALLSIYIAKVSKMLEILTSPSTTAEKKIKISQSKLCSGSANDFYQPLNAALKKVFLCKSTANAKLLALFDYVRFLVIRKAAKRIVKGFNMALASLLQKILSQPRQENYLTEFYRNAPAMLNPENILGPHCSVCITRLAWLAQIIEFVEKYCLFLPASMPQADNSVSEDLMKMLLTREGLFLCLSNVYLNRRLKQIQKTLREQASFDNIKTLECPDFQPVKLFLKQKITIFKQEQTRMLHKIDVLPEVAESKEFGNALLFLHEMAPPALQMILSLLSEY